jgi:bifunctional DNA-binding transcriptional regulator/antitoxin component of YhaV-PrlF toxin-antitoxin module
MPKPEVQAMRPRSATARISESGRLSIPADMRRELGIEKGGLVSLLIDETGLHIETTQQFVRRIQKMAREDGWHKAGSVDDFIASKREDARREIEEIGGGSS